MTADDDVQVRTLDGDLRYFPSVVEAFVWAEEHPGAWKVSWEDGTPARRARFVKRDEGGWDFEPLCPSCGTPYESKMKFNSGNPRPFLMSKCDCLERRTDARIDAIVARFSKGNTGD